MIGARGVLPPFLLVLVGLGAALLFGFYGGGFDTFRPITPSEITTTLRGGDFRIFWSTGYFVAQGDLARAHDDASLKALPPLQHVGVGGNLALYPPSWLLLVEQLGALDFPMAWALYLWGSVALFLLGVGLAFRGTPYAVPLALGFGGFWLALDFGQNTLGLAGLYLLTLAALPKRELAGGVCLGLATVKPHLGVLIPLFLLLRRHVGAIFWALVVLGGLIALAAHRYGPDVWTDYVESLRKPVNRLLAFETVRPEAMISTYAGLRLAGLTATHALIGQGLVALLALKMMVSVCRRSYDPHLPFAATITATLLVLPHAYGYDLVLLVIPILVLIARAQKRGWRLEDWEALLPAYLAPFFVVALNLAVRAPVFPLILLLLLHRLRYHSRYTAD